MWIPEIALIISIASLVFSLYVFNSNIKVTMKIKRMELLTKMKEAQIEYNTLNCKYKNIYSNSNSLPTDLVNKLVMYDEYEKNIDKSYKYVYSHKLSLLELT